MGLLDKVKGILFDEEEIEIPEIKKEPKNNNKNINKVIEPINKVEENPIKEIKLPKDDFRDSEYKSESTFTFPIDFEDEEPTIEPKIDERPKPRPIESRTIRRQENTISSSRDRDFSSFLNKKDERKKFKPTPIISPVYGILDQNYKKEDIIVKKETPSNTKSLEAVRKKAFGSLEEELEQNLTNTKEIKIETKTKKEVKQKKVEVEKPVDKLKTIGELIEEDSYNLDVPEIESINNTEVEYNNSNVEEIEKPKKNINELLDTEEKIIENDNTVDEIDDEEADLFSLIDSMYEEKGE